MGPNGDERISEARWSFSERQPRREVAPDSHRDEAPPVRIVVDDFPSAEARVALYFAGWCLLAFAAFIWDNTLPIYTVLEKKRPLPQLTRWLLAAGRTDAAWFHLPLIQVMLATAAISEAGIELLRRRKCRARLAWYCLCSVVAIGGVTLGVVFYLIAYMPIGGYVM